jgi:hypothetical protein
MIPTALGRLEISASKALVHYKVMKVDSRVKPPHSLPNHSPPLTPFSAGQDRSCLTCRWRRHLSLALPQHVSTTACVYHSMCLPQHVSTTACVYHSMCLPQHVSTTACVYHRMSCEGLHVMDVIHVMHVMQMMQEVKEVHVKQVKKSSRAVIQPRHVIQVIQVIHVIQVIFFPPLTAPPHRRRIARPPGVLGSFRISQISGATSLQGCNLTIATAVLARPHSAPLTQTVNTQTVNRVSGVLQ